MKISKLALQLKTLPDNAGVYKFYDKVGNILYIGKAKNIKKELAHILELNRKILKQIFL